MPQQRRLLVESAAIKLNDEESARAGIGFAMLRQFPCFRPPSLSGHRRRNDERTEMQASPQFLTQVCAKTATTCAHTQQRAAWKQFVDDLLGFAFLYPDAIRRELNKLNQGWPVFCNLGNSRGIRRRPSRC